jgi:hypothetical protein
MRMINKKKSHYKAGIEEEHPMMYTELIRMMPSADLVEKLASIVVFVGDQKQPRASVDLLFVR